MKLLMSDVTTLTLELLCLHVKSPRAGRYLQGEFRFQGEECISLICGVCPLLSLSSLPLSSPKGHGL